MIKSMRKELIEEVKAVIYSNPPLAYKRDEKKLNIKRSNKKLREAVQNVIDNRKVYSEYEVNLRVQKEYERGLSEGFKRSNFIQRISDKLLEWSM